MLINLLTNFVAVLIGGVITWLVSRRYYKKGGAELAAEAKKLQLLNEKLQRLTEITLHALEDAGMVKLNRNGVEIIGRIVDTRKPLPPQGAIVDKGDIIQYPDKYVEILRPEDQRSSKNRKPVSEVNAGPAVTGTITRGPIRVKSK